MAAKNPMRTIRRRTAALLFSALFLLSVIMPVTALAVEYNDSSPDDMITEAFNVDIAAGLDYNFHITEVIQVNFITGHHGIYRYIPQSDDYAIKNVRVESGEKYKTDKDDDSGSLMIKIGSAHEKLTGEHTYVISYDLDGYKDADSSRDILRIDLLPTGWNTSIRESQMHLSLPSAIDWSEANIRFGQYGSGYGLDDHFTQETTDTELTIHGTDLPQGYGVSAFASLPDGYWSEATPYRERHKILSGIYLISSVLSSLGAVLLWLRYGRDRYKMYRPVTVRPPADLTPAEIGYYYHHGAETHDMMTMLFYYANKGWLQIRPVLKKEKIKDYELVKLAPLGSSEKKFSRTLFNGLTANMVKSSVTLKNLERKLRNTDTSFVRTAMGEVEEGLKVNNEGTNILQRLLIIIISLAAILSGCAITEPDGIYIGLFVAALWLISALCLGSAVDTRKISRFLIGIITGLLAIAMLMLVLDGFGDVYRILILVMIPVSLVFYALMQSPSEEYTKLMGEIYGFRDYIEKADEQRLKTLVAENPDYFYNILPYAAVFGLEKEWSDQFTKIGAVPERPSWYDYDGVFVYSPMWTTRMMSSMDSSFKVTSDSSDSGGSFSSGFSGGGFSGGGFGGGGGGGW